MSEKKRNNNVGGGAMKPQVNPFTNEDLYPITGFLTSSFMDPYLQNHYGHGNQILDDGFNVTKVWSEYAKYLSKLANKLKDFFAYFNENNMQELKKAYEEFTQDFKTKVPIHHNYDYLTNHNISQEVIESLNKTFSKIDQQFTKQSFLQNFAEVIKLMIDDYIDKYNQTHTDTSVFMESTEIVCLTRYNGLLVLDSTLLDSYELNMLSQSNRDIFKIQEQENNLITDCVFIVYSHLLFHINKKPIGVMYAYKNTSNPFDRFFVEYYNSCDVVELSDDDYPDDTDDDDDDYEDFDDLDDEDDDNNNIIW